MKMARIITMKPLKSQKGVTLVELLVAAVISLIAVSGMVLLMASTLGTSAYTIKMSRVTHDMRTAMQIMTRELRRANYHEGWLACYGDMGCRKNDELGIDIEAQINRIRIGDSVGTNDCLWFWYDRPQLCQESSCTAEELKDDQLDVTLESVAAFRRAETGGVGRIQMTTTREIAASCATSPDWVDITDPNIMDVLAFTVTNADPDFPSIFEELNTALDSQNVEKIGLVLTARLTAHASVPAWIQGNANATRTMDEFVSVRNNITTAAP
jgi:type II secretory pathway component PulJ